MPLDNNKRIAKNTLMLYIRQILILLVSLYTVRVVLDVLGIEDYGIYSVVGGIVSLFSFFSVTMSSATQRFFSFALGQNDFEKLKKIFIVNFIIYVVIAVVIFVLLESIGLWYVYERLNVPIERFESAYWIYHFSIFTFIATMFSTPFVAIIIAHEDMKIYAYVSIADSIMKLCIVFLLKYLPWDKLELYGMLVFEVSVFISLIYIVICVRKYKECQFKHFCWDKNLMREIIGFTGWTMFGQASTVARNQAVTILLNQMFNPTIVAAKAIANNVTNAINMFSNSFNLGLYPPIIKLYAAGNKKEMFSLILRGSKMTFFLMWIFALPLFIEMEAILKIWLKNPPSETLLFTRLALLEVLINSVSLPITTAARAPGKMKVYELTLGIIQIAIFIVSWIVLKLGAEAYSIFVIAIAANCLMFLVRLLIVRTLIGIPVRPFFIQVIFPIFFIILVSATLSFTTHWILPSTFIFVFISIFLSVIISCGSMFFIGLKKLEREKVRKSISIRIKKITN